MNKGQCFIHFPWIFPLDKLINFVNKDTTTIVDGKGDADKIAARIEELQVQIEKATSPYEKEKLQERLAKFVGGVAIIHVGDNSELEMKKRLIF